MELYIIDAFSTEIFGGNPAGVVIILEKEEIPTDEFMQKLASELRYSETAFVRIYDKDKLSIRYFTPSSEVDICGHATIASFVALRDLGFLNNSYMCNTKAGDIIVDLEEEKISMSMGRPSIIKSNLVNEEIKEIYDIMGIPDDIFKNGELKPEIVLCGLTDMILPVSRLETLNNINPNFKRLVEFSEKHKIVGVHAFACCNDFATAHCRNFAPLYDINEECATGTSNGGLSFYLYDKNLVSKDTNLTFIQGEKMGRPSIISVKIKIIDGQVIVYVGGSGVILVKGKITV